MVFFCFSVIPGTNIKLLGFCIITSSVSSPKTSTIFLAIFSPIPLKISLDKKITIASFPSGFNTSQLFALNCNPYFS
jgi:hypothetical protein